MRWFLSLDLCKCLGQKKYRINSLTTIREFHSKVNMLGSWKEVHIFSIYLYVCSFDIILKDLENVFHVGFHYVPCFQAVCCNLSRLCVVGSSSIFSKIFSSLPHLSKQVASLICGNYHHKEFVTTTKNISLWNVDRVKIWHQILSPWQSWFITEKMNWSFIFSGNKCMSLNGLCKRLFGPIILKRSSSMNLSFPHVKTWNFTWKLCQRLNCLHVPANSYI